MYVCMYVYIYTDIHKQYKQASTIFNQISIGEIDIDQIDKYWGMLSKYINNEIDLKIEDDVLYFNEVDESEYEEGC